MINQVFLYQKSQDEEGASANREGQKRIDADGGSCHVGDIGSKYDHTSVSQINQIHHPPDDGEAYGSAGIEPAGKDPVYQNLPE